MPKVRHHRRTESVRHEHHKRREAKRKKMYHGLADFYYSTYKGRQNRGMGLH